MDPIHDDNCDEIDAILHAVQECCREELTGMPADVPNPIVDTQELLDAVRVKLMDTEMSCAGCLGSLLIRWAAAKAMGCVRHRCLQGLFPP